MKKSKMTVKRLCSVSVAFMLVFMMFCTSVFASNAATDDQPTVSVVNFSPKWGDKQANIEAMTKLIEEAAENGTDIILFPEMAVTGYSTGMEYLQGSEIPMPVELAEPKTGQTAAYFSDMAEKYNMYIIYGGTETVEGDSEHAYNSAFICTPDGMIDSYQKISPVEGDWCKAGTTPKYFSTPWGLVGVSICYDTYSVPEIGRLYSASGCFMMLNPTAVVGGDWGWDYFDYSDAVYCEYTNDYYIDEWQDYYRLYLETDVFYDGLYIASSNILGTDGPNDVRNFEGGSLIIGPSNTVSTAPTNDKYDYITYYAGSTSNSEYGMVTATIDPSLATNSLTSMSIFQPELYTEWFNELAQAKITGTQLVAPATANEDPVCAVVNMNPVWGDKEANSNMMLKYMEEAYESGVNIIVFPEMALTDYASTSDPDSEKWKMVCEQAETTDGTYALKIQEKAIEYGMYVIYGTSEVNPDDYGHPYNSAFVATPDGETLSYQKIQPVEGDWCKYGNAPLIVETPWGGMGLSICMDTYAYPELERYYAAAGCKMIINPTASGGYARKNFAYNTTLASIASRDGMLVLSSDLVGEGGSSDGSTVFPGKSTIIGRNYISPIYYSEESMTDETMYIATPNMSTIGFAITNYNPEVLFVGYAKIAAGEDLYDFSGLVEAMDYADFDAQSSTELTTVTTQIETINTTDAATQTTKAATEDSVKGKTTDNATVKTGFNMTNVYVLLMVLATAVTLFVYNKKRSK